jgi:NADPH:quinone reductase-like Zn-dependent oxidoreductase
MRTVYRPGYGAPDVLEVREAPVPVPRPGDILVRVHASSVNRTDVGVLRGTPYVFRLFAGFPSPRYSATGTDFAGEVVKVGDGVTAFATGDRVYGFNDRGLGTHRELATIGSRETVLTIPSNLSFAEAVGCTEGAHYAVNFINKIDLRPGQQVLVIGGTGAIGSAAVQLLRARGVVVDATAPAAHAELVRSLGARTVYDVPGREHLESGLRYDAVFDAVGKSRFEECRPVMAPHAVYLSSELGPSGENLWLPIRTMVGGGPTVRFPFPSNTKASLSLVRGLAENGHFHAVIDRTYPLEEVRDAFRYVESGRKVGTVVLDVS